MYRNIASIGDGEYHHPLPNVNMPKSFPTERIPKSDDDDTMLCKRVVTKDRRYITQITCYEKGSEDQTASEDTRSAMRLPVFGKQSNGGALASLFSFPGGSRNRPRQTPGTCEGGRALTREDINMKTYRPTTFF